MPVFEDCITLSECILHADTPRDDSPIVIVEIGERGKVNRQSYTGVTPVNVLFTHRILLACERDLLTFGVDMSSCTSRTTLGLLSTDMKPS